MKVRRKKRTVWTAWAAAALMSVSAAFPAGAVTLDWNDLTDAQQENAYKALESENESLKQQITALEEKLGIQEGSMVQDTDAADSAAGN